MFQSGVGRPQKRFGAAGALLAVEPDDRRAAFGIGDRFSDLRAGAQREAHAHRHYPTEFHEIPP